MFRARWIFHSATGSASSSAGLTLRSSGPPPAWPREPLRLIICLARPCRWRPLSSNVRRLAATRSTNPSVWLLNGASKATRLEVRVCWLRKEKAAPLSLFVSRGTESKVSARAEARARANVDQSVGPLLRIGGTCSAREAPALRHRRSGCEPNSPRIRIAPGRKDKASLFVLSLGATVRLCKPRLARTTRRLTLRSSGPATAGHACPSFHSEPSAARRCGPLTSNVSPPKVARCDHFPGTAKFVCRSLALRPGGGFPPARGLGCRCAQGRLLGSRVGPW